MKILFLLFLFSRAAFGMDFAAMKLELAKKFPYQQVLAIKKTPYSGLYEVDFEDRLIYVDEKLNYIFSGNVIEMRTMKNLTEAREKALFAVKFDALPLDLALKKVKGNGKRRLAVFSDPNCPYCKKLEKELAGIDDVTVYLFPISVLPGSAEKMKAIWCEPHPMKAWEDHMLRGIDPAAGRRCDLSGLEKISQLAKKLGVNVTPTLIFENGTNNVGLLPREEIEKYLAP